MNISQAVKMAAKSISSNKGRSFLTMLGIIIGLAAVIILVSYAEGQNMAMKAYYESMGTNTLSVSAYNWMDSSNNVGQQLYDYCLGMKEIQGITPNGYVSRDVTISYGAKTLARNRNYGGGMVVVGGGGMSVSYGGGSDDHYPQIRLGNDKYGLCNDYKIAKGREFSYLEIQNMSQVCILGSDTAEYLFSFADPIDKIISVNGLPFRVIGVYQSKAAGINLGNSEDSYWMSESIKRNDQLLLLPSSMTRYFNNNESITDYTVKVKDSDSITKVVTDLNGFLSNIVNTDYGGYYVDNPQQWQDSQNEAAALQQRFLGGIAAISLLVGGIGIMNIMLVTVTERTREIGIRKAIGAERRSIITQFLIEAAMICGIGGILGIVVGYIGTMVVTKLSFGLVLMPGSAITMAAFVISVALGIIFGLYPAIKASALQPVEALRAD